MAGFGEKLRVAREQKGFSIEAIEDETKIRKLYLEALEKEAFTILPARVYAVGFVKRYAQFLDLDVEELSREFKEIAYGTDEEEETPVLQKPVEQSSILERIPVKNLFFAVGFLLLAIWVGNYFVAYIGNGLTKQEPGKAPVVNEKNNLPEKNPAATPEPPTSSDTLDMVVKVKSDQRCWVLVRVDGEEKIAGILESGNQQSFSARDSIYIKVGNASAIDIIINNKKIEPLGPGPVEEKEFKNGNKY